MLTTDTPDTDTPVTERDRWFAGTLMRVLAGRDDTGGALTVLEQRAGRGFSPPLHVHHREDTAMLVLSGDVTFRIGGDERTLGSGGFVWLPREVPHTFRVDSGEAHLLEFALPGGVEAFHVDASDPADALTLPPDPTPDIARMMAAAQRHDVDIIGPPMT